MFHLASLTLRTSVTFGSLNAFVLLTEGSIHSLSLPRSPCEDPEVEEAQFLSLSCHLAGSEADAARVAACRQAHGLGGKAQKGSSLCFHMEGCEQIV